MQIDLSPAALGVLFSACSALVAASWRVGVASTEYRTTADALKADLESVQQLQRDSHDEIVALRAELESVRQNQRDWQSEIVDSLRRCQDRHCA